MYRIIEQRHRWYALRVDSIEDDAENIEDFVKDGDIVIIVDDLKMLSQLGIDPDEVELIS